MSLTLEEMDIIDCDKKCKDCGDKFPFRGNFRSINKRKFCDKCKKEHKKKPPISTLIPLPKKVVVVKVKRIPPKETRPPLGQRKCYGCDNLVIIYSLRGNGKRYCKDCKTVRRKINREAYLKKYVERNYDTS